MARVAHLKLQYFGHAVRGSAGALVLTVIEGSMEETRKRGNPKNELKSDLFLCTFLFSLHAFALHERQLFLIGLAYSHACTLTFRLFFDLNTSL